MITDYATLKASIADWLHRSDLVAAIPDFITLCETRMNRNLRVRQMQMAFTQSISAPNATLPVNWLEFIDAPTLDGAPLDLTTRGQFKERQRAQDYGNYYSVLGSTIYIGNRVTEPVDLEFDYYAKIPNLAIAPNWAVVDAPDVYLYGSLVEAEPYLKNDARVETWRGFLQVALTDLQAASDKAAITGGALLMSAPR